VRDRSAEPDRREDPQGEGLIAKRSLTQSPVKAKKPLRIALRNLKKALRVALARRDKDKLDDGCASVLEAEINDMLARATAVRDQLGSCGPRR
jgi:hypothetical protein